MAYAFIMAAATRPLFRYRAVRLAAYIVILCYADS